MTPPSEANLLQACRTLFGDELILNREFLHYLQPSGARLAYRTMVKVHHPDRFADASQHVRQQQTERFREIHQAYNLLKTFLDQRHCRRLPPVQSYSPTQHTAPQAHRPARPRTTPPGSRAVRVPAIPMEFGMYAYYQGKISYQDLIEALVWQRRQRPAMGDIARKWGWLTDIQVRRTLEYRGHAQRFGKKAVELGYLRPHQVDVLINHQRTLQQRLGQYFVSKGLMSSAEADHMAQSLQSHNSRVSQQDRQHRTARR